MSLALSSLLHRSKQLMGTIRLSPFDTATEEGRSRERMRRVGLTALAGMLAKVISILTTLITIPLTLNYLGAERYGVWMSISALVAMLGFADLGMGHGLLTSIAKAHGDNDKNLAARYVSSAFFLLLTVALVLFGIFLAVSPFIAWGAVFNVHDLAVVRSIAPTVTVVVAMFALSMPLGTVQRTQAGYQEGFQSSLWQCVGSVATLTAVYAAISQKASLPILVLCLVGAPVVIMLCNWIAFFGVQRQWLLPRLSQWDKQTATSLMKTGFLFFILQITMALAFSSDNIVAAHQLGQTAVAQLAVVSRLFSMIAVVIGMLMQPFWPAYREAAARGDMEWVKRTLKRTLLFSFGISSVISLLLVILGSQILRAWVGSQIVVPLSLLVVCGIWMVLSSVGSALAMFLNGMNIVRMQVIHSTLFGIVAVVLKIHWASIYGNTGIVLASIIAYLSIIIIPYAFKFPKILRKMKGTSQGNVLLS